VNNKRQKVKFKKIPGYGNLTNEEIDRPGGLLIAALMCRAYNIGLNHKEMAHALGVGHPYIHQLRKGIRRIDQVSDDFCNAAAAYLEIPFLSVKILAGRVNSIDLFESKKVMTLEISRAIECIFLDSKWGHLVTPELKVLNELSQYGLVKMYEAATGKCLLNKELDFISLAQQIGHLNEVITLSKKSDVGHAEKKTRSWKLHLNRFNNE
jgi:hypothetical protein